MNVKLDMTNEAYHLEPSLSASGAKKIALGSPAEFKYGEFKSNPAFDTGTATHTMVFEPHNAENVWCGPETRRGLDWKRKKLEAEEAGALLLTESDYRLAADMAEAVRSNRAAAELLSGDLVCEASIFSKDPSTGVEMRCRPDGWRRDIGALIDLKTTIASDPEGFAKQCANLGYHIQDMFYRRCMENAGFEIDRFCFIAVQKTRPHLVGIYELDWASLDEGKAAVEYALEKYRKASESNEWGYDFGDLKTIQIPRYSFKFSQID